MNCPNLTTFVSPLLPVVVDLFQLCSRGSQSLRSSSAPTCQSCPWGAQCPSLQEALFSQADSTGRGFSPMELQARDCPCHWPLAIHLQRCCTRDTHSHLSCSPAQFNYQLGSSPAKHKKSTHCSCFGVLLPC